MALPKTKLGKSTVKKPKTNTKSYGISSAKVNTTAAVTMPQRVSGSPPKLKKKTFTDPRPGA